MFKFLKLVDNKVKKINIVEMLLDITCVLYV